MTLPELYDFAVDHGIDVDWWSSMPSAKSFAIFDPRFDRCAVVMDPWKFSTELPRWKTNTPRSAMRSGTV